MSLLYPFHEVIEEIHNELGKHYEGDCIRWVDENFDNAWSKLLDQFDAILLTKDRMKINVFCGMYRTQVLGYIDAFKKQKALAKSSDFLAHLKAGTLPPPKGAAP